MLWLNEIEKVLDSTTEGKWYWHTAYNLLQSSNGRGDAREVLITTKLGQPNNQDALFIAESRSYVMKLIAAMYVLDKAVTNVIAELEETHLDDIYQRSAYELLGKLHAQLQSGNFGEGEPNG